MLDWNLASKATKVTLLGALGCIALGLVLAVVGSAVHATPLLFAALGVLALGIVTHLVGYGFRLADSRRRMRQAVAADPSQRTSKKGSK